MKTLAKSIGLILLFFIALAALMFLPPVTETVTRLLLTYYLQQKVSLHHASVSLDHYTVEGKLDDRNSFAWDVDYTFLDDYKILLSFDGDIDAFAPALKTALPHIQGHFKADYNGKSALLKINATLLEGNASAVVDVDERTYRYALERLDIASFLLQQEEKPYAGGLLSMHGKGVLEAPYTSDFMLKSSDLSLKTPLFTALHLSEQTRPVSGVLGIRGGIDTEKLTISGELDSEMARISIAEATYDLVGGDYLLALTAKNRTIDALPAKNLALRAVGNYSGHTLTSDAALTADAYRLGIDELAYQRDEQRVTADYRLTTKGPALLDLSGDTALFGTVAFEKGDLVMDLRALAMNDPLLLTFEQKRLDVISNNIPLAMLWKTALIPPYASGSISLRASADLSEKIPSWQGRLESKGVRLEESIAKELDSNGKIKITVDANGGDSGKVTILPKIKSDIATTENARIEYLPDKKSIGFSGEFKTIRLPHYTASSVMIKGNADTEKGRVTKTLFRSPYETLSISELNWKEKPVRGHFGMRITALDRFLPADGAYAISATGRFESTDKQTRVDVKSEQLGPYSFLKNGDTYTISGGALPVGEIYKLTDQPAQFSGDLDFSLRYSGKRLQARAGSEKISPVEATKAFRPFKLSARADFISKKGGYYGKADIKTSNEALELGNVSINPSKKLIKSDYLLDLKRMEEALVRLPEPLAGAMKANGTFELGDVQLLTLHTQNFPLPVDWHRYLDPNATSPLDTDLDAKLRRAGDSVTFKGRLKNSLIDIASTEVNLDLNTNDFNLSSILLTELWLKDTNISLTGKFGRDRVRLEKAEARSAYEELRLSDLSYVIPEQNLSVQYRLKLLSSTQGAAPYYSDALLRGKIETHPRFRASMESESFEGNLSALMTDETLTVASERFSLPALLAFTGKKTPIAKGDVNASIILGSPALLENNMSKLVGSTDINVTGLLLRGSNLDGYLEKLKATQDLSLFRNNFFDLPIFGVIGDTSEALVTKKSAETIIKSARLKTDIYKGYIQCRDCALATKKNRVAATGVIDLPKKSFHDFYVAVLNPAGCAYFVQQIKGSLDDPKIDLAVTGIKVIGGAVESVASNVGDAARIGTEIVGKTGKFVGNIVSYVPIVGGVTDKTVTTVTDVPSEATMLLLPGECSPFYRGSVSHPISEK
jgi:hypothetical protein